eukprot:CAMPEP_0194514738 /NCGR_PEP_ID=MMETSP0253-20130528/47269_1 /TAXON_ID=2966 /ORGANISM="Noctiluca scintillans" /LENGTH=33 /DNA_ID= /DNA_START= /DNA_END= /DNA_ORIENTATION=
MSMQATTEGVIFAHLRRSDASCCRPNVEGPCAT